MDHSLIWIFGVSTRLLGLAKMSHFLSVILDNYMNSYIPVYAFKYCCRILMGCSKLILYMDAIKETIPSVLYCI